MEATSQGAQGGEKGETMNNSTMAFVSVKVKKASGGKVKLRITITAEDGTKHKRTVKVSEGDVVGIGAIAFAIEHTEGEATE